MPANTTPARGFHAISMRHRAPRAGPSKSRAGWRPIQKVAASCLIVPPRVRPPGSVQAGQCPACTMKVRMQHLVSSARAVVLGAILIFLAALVGSQPAPREQVGPLAGG